MGCATIPAYCMLRDISPHWFVIFFFILIRLGLISNTARRNWWIFQSVCNWEVLTFWCVIQVNCCWFLVWVVVVATARSWTSWTYLLGYNTYTCSFPNQSRPHYKPRTLLRLLLLLWMLRMCLDINLLMWPKCFSQPAILDTILALKKLFLFSSTCLNLALFFFILDLFLSTVLLRRLIREAKTQGKSMLLCWLDLLKHATLLHTSLLDKPAFGIIKLLFFRKDFGQVLPCKWIGGWRGIDCVLNRVPADLSFILSFG